MRKVGLKRVDSYFFCILTLFFSLSFNNLCFAQSVSQIEKSQQDLEKERALRAKIEQEEKVFVKKIIIEGATLISAERIKEIILPFQKRWLSKEEILQILHSLTAAYKEKGYSDQPAKISYQIKKASLKIKIEELTH